MNANDVFDFNIKRQLARKKLILFIGHSGSGKTFNMFDALYTVRNDFDIITAFVASSDEAVKLEKHIPQIFIHTTMDIGVLNTMYDDLDRMKAIEKRGGPRCPRWLLYIDDFGYLAQKLFSTDVFRRVAFNIRHLEGLAFISIQDAKLVGPAIRGNTAQVFACFEKRMEYRKRLYEVYNPCFDSFEEFDDCMKKCTTNNGTMVIDYDVKSYNVRDNVFRHAPVPRPKFKFNKHGSIWQYNKRNFDRKHYLRKKIPVTKGKRAAKPTQLVGRSRFRK